MYFVYTTAAMALGFLLDLLLGDPRGMWHPIIAIGHLIEKTEKLLRRCFPKNQKGEFWGGICLVVVVTAVSTAVPLALTLLCYRVHPLLGFLEESLLCWMILAAKSLKTESMRVAKALEQEGLSAGRTAVSFIVGRDTAHLDEPGVVKAAVETVAENASDGVIAPLLFLALGGPTLGFFYKSVNTMDSMVGYKNETYLYFGRGAAKTDDVVNFIPARISAWLMIAGAYLGGFSGKDALKIYQRDRRNHASPNSAQTEAVMAGALQVQLAGPAWYFGKRLEKPTIGDDVRPVERDDIGRANRLLYRTAWLGLLLCVLVKGAVLLLLR